MHIVPHVRCRSDDEKDALSDSVLLWSSGIRLIFGMNPDLNFPKGTHS